MNIYHNFILISLMIVKLNCDPWQGDAQQFAHNVVITTAKSKDTEMCSGSIISDMWILTCMRCVQFSPQFRIDFNRKILSESYAKYSIFSIVIGSSGVVLYPTEIPEQDNIALIKLPVKLDFTNRAAYYLKPIGLFLEEYEYNTLAVMPVFSNDENGNGILRYGKYQRTHDCVGYNDKTQFCVRGWNNGLNIPCDTSQGSGLILHWGTQYPRLVGIYSHSTECKPGIPFIYTAIKPYVTWIRSVIINNGSTTHG